MDQEPFGHHLNDVARLGVGQGRFEHGLMQLRVKFIANFRHNRVDSVLAEDRDQLAQRQLNAFKNTLGRLALRLVGTVQSTLEIVIDGHQITGEL